MNKHFLFRISLLILFLSFTTFSHAQRRAPRIGSRLNAPQVARHGMTAAKYQQEFSKWTGKGYRLTHVSGYGVGGQARYAAIWTKVDGPAWKAHHGLSNTAYQQKVDTYVKQGYRIAHVSGYDVKGKDYYAAIFVKNSGTTWVARHRLNGSQYQQEYNKWKSKGYRLVHVSGYAISGKAHYAAIWEKRSGAAMATHHGMTSSVYQQKFNQYVGKGYRLTHVSAYTVSGKDYYAAIWEKRAGKKWTARHRMNNASYQNEFDNNYYTAYRIKSVSGYAIGGKAHYAAIWTEGAFSSSEIAKVDKIAKDFMKKYNVPGLQIAITKDERLVFAKGYGYADKEKGVLMGPNVKGRIASVSKPITAVGIMKLAQANKLTMNKKVMGSGSILGSAWAGKTLTNREKSITVANLLEHTAGANVWDNNGKFDHNGKDESPVSWDPMFQQSSYNHAQLIGWVLDNRNPDYNPGTYYAYSNFGYCMLGRIIEKISKQAYETWIKNNVLKPCGINGMFVSGDTKAQKRSNEMVYYGQNGENPYGMKVKRMDSHGGWAASTIDLMRFMVRVDGKPKKKDIISTSSFNTMTSKSSYGGSVVNSSNYGKGWNLSGTKGMSHGGSLPGTYSRIARRDDGFCYAVIINTRSKASGFGGDFNGIGPAAVKAIKSWPAYDKF